MKFGIDVPDYGAYSDPGVLVVLTVEYWHEYFRQFVKRNLTNEMWEDMKWGWPDETFRKRVTGGDQCVA